MLHTVKLRRLPRSLARVARTHYPAFLLGRPVTRGEIPVFTYHDVTADELSSDLEFLCTNAYRTLSMDEFYNSRRGGWTQTPDKSVLLTFDDARRSFWDVAYPLLHRFRAHATLFVPSFWITGGNSGSSNAGSDANGMFMTWEQIAHCQDSGLIDVESHAHRHALVYVSQRLAGFASPGTRGNYDLYDWPMRREGTVDRTGCPALGTPVYEARPLLSVDYRVFELESVVHACRETVVAEGEMAFFQRPDWESTLRTVYEQAATRTKPASRMPKDEFQELVASEFAQSIACFERELGRRPRVLAYPWMLGSALSLRLARDYDFTAAFGVGLDFRHARRVRILPVFGRYKADWLRFLPGQGRLRLREILPRKLAAFTRSQHLAH